MRKASAEQEADDRAAMPDNDAEEGHESGFLESLKGKFSFEQVPMKVHFSPCSVQNQQIDEILRFIAEHA